MKDIEESIINAKLEIEVQNELAALEQELKVLAPKWYSFFLSYVPIFGMLMFFWLNEKLNELDDLIIVLLFLIGTIIGDNHRKNEETNKRIDVLKKYILKRQDTNA